jgi:putative membrane protein
MWLDALLAYLHFTAIFGLVGFMAAELVFIRGALDASAVRRLVKVDVAYFISAMVVLVTGGLRLALGAKGPDFYLNAWPFYVKFGLFIAVGVISIQPTLLYGRWKRAFEHDAAWSVPEEDRKRVRRLMLIQVHLAGMIPVFAVVMSRGLGS